MGAENMVDRLARRAAAEKKGQRPSQHPMIAYFETSRAAREIGWPYVEQRWKLSIVSSLCSTFDQLTDYNTTARIGSDLLENEKMREDLDQLTEAQIKALSLSRIIDLTWKNGKNTTTYNLLFAADGNEDKKTGGIHVTLSEIQPSSGNKKDIRRKHIRGKERVGNDDFVEDVVEDMLYDHYKPYGMLSDEQHRRHLEQLSDYLKSHNYG